MSVEWGVCQDMIMIDYTQPFGGAGNAAFAAQNQARAPSLAPSTPALSSTAALAPTPASAPASTLALAVAPTPAPASITSGANVGASVSVAKGLETSLGAKINFT